MDLDIDELEDTKVLFHLKIPGKPIGKGRPRFTKFGHAYTPDKTRNYEKMVKEIFISQYGNTTPLETNVDLKIDCFFTFPTSYSIKKRKNLIFHSYAKKPDVDNIIKIILDSLNNLAYLDDKQVVHLEITKTYAEEDYVEIKIKESKK